MWLFITHQVSWLLGTSTMSDASDASDHGQLTFENCSHFKATFETHGVICVMAVERKLDIPHVLSIPAVCIVRSGISCGTSMKPTLLRQKWNVRNARRKLRLHLILCHLKTLCPCIRILQRILGTMKKTLAREGSPRSDCGCAWNKEHQSGHHRDCSVSRQRGDRHHSPAGASSLKNRSTTGHGTCYDSSPRCSLSVLVEPSSSRGRATAEHIQGVTVAVLGARNIRVDTTRTVLAPGSEVTGAIPLSCSQEDV